MTSFFLHYVLTTILFFPIYLWLRRPFFQLPLHRDTGFYVSNQTIMKKKISYSQGWNAQFALCSKVIPEFFYSWLYLKFKGVQYQFYSRLYYSFWNYATGIAVGIAAVIAGDGNWIFYPVALISFSFLSSHPHSGIYFENGEQFEMLFQVIGGAAILYGIKEVAITPIVMGLSIWLLEAFFIKTVSLLSVFLLSAGLLWWRPALWPALIIAVAISFLLYYIWVRLNGQHFLKMIGTVWGHESYSQGALSAEKILKQIYRKCRFLWIQLWGNGPLFLVGVMFGLTLLQTENSFLWLYLVAVTATYFFQAALVWYYFLPLLPPLTIVVSLGFVQAWAWGAPTQVAIAVLGAVWLFQHYKRVNQPIDKLTLSTWKPYGDFMGRQNLALENFAKKARPMVGDHTLFVYGVCNQFYVLMDTAYPTNLISGAAWLDTMYRDWQQKLNHQLVENPPEFIFSSDRYLNIALLGDKLGLKYELIDQAEPALRLFQLKQEVTQQMPLDYNTKPYQTEAVLSAREQEQY